MWRKQQITEYLIARFGPSVRLWFSAAIISDSSGYRKNVTYLSYHSFTTFIKSEVGTDEERFYPEGVTIVMITDA